MEALSPALYAILASEGRSDLTNPQKSIAASVLLAAEVWDHSLGRFQPTLSRWQAAAPCRPGPPYPDPPGHFS